VTCYTYADRVAFPDDVLAPEEELVLHLRPHWKAGVLPILVLVFTLTLIIVVWVVLPDNHGGWIGIWVVGLLSLFFAITRGVRPLLVWRCTHFVFTDERVLLQDGVIARERRDLPLARVNDHAMSQSLLDRLLGCGTLRVDSIGDQVAVLESVPHVEQVQTMLYELIDADRALHPDDEEDEEPELPVQPDRRGLRRFSKN
jgi:uncharacterized membrane protein YdbT with pleckstrin-like domain